MPMYFTSEWGAYNNTRWNPSRNQELWEKDVQRAERAARAEARVAEAERVAAESAARKAAEEAKKIIADRDSAAKRNAAREAVMAAGRAACSEQTLHADPSWDGYIAQAGIVPMRKK